MIKFLTTSFGEIGEGEGDTSYKSYESDYIAKYRDAVTNIARGREWKNSGRGAEFTRRVEHEYEDMSGSVNGVCAYIDGSCLYSARAGQVSGIIIKDLASGEENYLIHSNSQIFGSLEYNSEAKSILSSVSTGGVASDIAVYNVSTNDLRAITVGDSVDEFPSYSKTSGEILYSSRGVGRDAGMQVVDFSDSEIMSIRKNGNIDVLLSEQGYDLLAPKDDSRGNLYYLRKPSKRVKQEKGVLRILLDILLLPFWLFYGLVRLLVFFASLSKNKNKKDKKNDVFSTSGGVNPALNRGEENSKLQIYGEEIDIAPKKNKKKDDDDGFAPEHFELWRRKPDGSKEKLKSGVLSFDVNATGDIIFTNGKSVVFRPADGAEQKLCRRSAVINAKFNQLTEFAEAESPF